MPGPVPKRSTERRRRNADSKPDTVTAGAEVVDVPECPPGLHPIAAKWFEGHRTSATRVYFEPSDWAAIEYVAHEMSRALTNRFSAHAFAAIMAAFTETLTTEASRRRARIEIERAGQSAEVPEGVIAMDDYRESIGG